MLAGLLFAQQDADDRPGQLTATLPFGGVTIIEYQARLLIAAGAAQLVVVVGRLTPELLGALGRIGKRGIAVDAVRSAAEASAKLHPLARIVMLADGLITTQDVIDGFAEEGSDALLVVPDATAPIRYERLGGGTAWAGVARLDARRIADVAALPRDYDLQSTALRLADQARAAHVPLAEAMLRDGHGIEHSSAALAVRGKAVLAATVADRRNWFNAIVLAPLARALVPRLIERRAGTAGIALGGAGLGAVGAALTLAGSTRSGLIVALVGCLLLGLGRTLAILRDEAALVRAQTIGIAVVPALATVALGLTLGMAQGQAVGLVGALMLLYLGGLGERAIQRSRRRPWWGGPPAYLLLLAGSTLIGTPLSGVALTVAYAASTLAAAVEALRRPA